MTAPLRIAGIGDLHVSDTVPRPLGELFAEISERADVLALCGDLTNLGSLAEARILAEELRHLKIPAVGVLGNHDHECGNTAEVARLLCEAGMKPLDDHTHVIGGVGFAGVKGFGGGFDARMLGAFGEPAIKAFVQEALNEAMRLENAIHSLDCERMVVVLHYAPISATCQGEPPEIFPFLGSSRLAETIDRFPVSAVLHGHAHHGSFRGTTPRGIPVYNCAATVAKDGGWPYAVIEV